MTRRAKLILTAGGGILLALGITAGLVWHARGPIIRDVALNLRAGAQARDAENPFERFLELRYGPMTEASNRETAFLSFFDSNHIQGMHRLVGYMKDDQRKTNILASAAWIAQYRESMSLEEKTDLASWIQSPEGRASVRQASAVFRNGDVAYRSATEPVVQELLTTLSALQQVALHP